MATEVETNNDVGVTTLISGIVQDARELFVEQMTLFQVEIKNDVKKTVSAMAPIFAGAGVSMVGLIVLAIGVANLLNWAVPEMPVWVGYVIVGGGFALVGGLLILWGKSMLEKVTLTPDIALKGLKENLQWKTKN